MNIVAAFAQWMQDEETATLGQNLFISRTPSSNSSDPNGNTIPKNTWRLKANGGTAPQGMSRKSDRIIEVYYRDFDAETVYDTLEDLADTINCACLDLQDHTVYSNKATAPFTDDDLDEENMTIGLVQVTITILNKGC